MSLASIVVLSGFSSEPWKHFTSSGTHLPNRTLVRIEQNTPPSAAPNHWLLHPWLFTRFFGSVANITLRKKWGYRPLLASFKRSLWRSNWKPDSWKPQSHLGLQESWLARLQNRWEIRGQRIQSIRVDCPLADWSRVDCLRVMVTSSFHHVLGYLKRSRHNWIVGHSGTIASELLPAKLM